MIYPSHRLWNVFNTVCDFAKQKNKEALAKYIDDHKVCIDFCLNDYNPITLLAEQGEHDAVEFLIREFNAEKASAATGYAAGNYIVELEKLLAEIEREKLLVKEICLIVALSGAAKRGDVPRVNHLIAQGAKSYIAAEYYAEGAQVVEVEKVIAAARKKGNSQSEWNKVAKCYAKGGHFTLAKQMVDRGADVSEFFEGLAIGGHLEQLNFELSTVSQLKEEVSHRLVDILTRGGHEHSGEMLHESAATRALRGYASGGHIGEVNKLLALGIAKPKDAFESYQSHIQSSENLSRLIRLTDDSALRELLMAELLKRDGLTKEHFRVIFEYVAAIVNRLETLPKLEMLTQKLTVQVPTTDLLSPATLIELKSKFDEQWKVSRIQFYGFTYRGGWYKLSMGELISFNEDPIIKQNIHQLLAFIDNQVHESMRSEAEKKLDRLMSSTGKQIDALFPASQEIQWKFDKIIQKMSDGEKSVQCILGLEEIVETLNEHLETFREIILSTAETATTILTEFFEPLILNAQRQAADWSDLPDPSVLSHQLQRMKDLLLEKINLAPLQMMLNKFEAAVLVNKDTYERHCLADVLERICYLYRQDNDVNPAVTLERLQSLCHSESTVSPEPDYLAQTLDTISVIHRGDIALSAGVPSVMYNVGMICNLKRDSSTANHFFNIALAFQYRFYGRNHAHSDIANTLYQIGILSNDRRYGGLYHIKTALDCLTKALNVQQTLYGKDTPHPDTANTLCALGKTYANDDGSTRSPLSSSCKVDKALDYLTQALEMQQRLYGKRTCRLDIANTCFFLHCVYIRAKNTVLARQYAQQALNIYTRFPEGKKWEIEALQRTLIKPSSEAKPVSPSNVPSTVFNAVGNNASRQSTEVKGQQEIFSNTVN